jgi:DNA-binding response OmpR family regulator
MQPDVPILEGVYTKEDISGTRKLMIIAVIEDERQLLDLLCEVLRDDGYDVVGFSHPRVAVESLADVGPALLLIDMQLPGMSGLELAALLRRGDFATTPMIAMSASNLRLEEARRSAIFDEILPKPFELSRVYDCVQQFAS